MFLNYKSILLWVVILLTGSLNEVKSQSIVSKSYYTEGGDVKVSVTITDGPGNPKDWIGIYKDGQEPGKVDAFTWIYVDGTQSGNTGVDSVTLSLPHVTSNVKFIAGKYKAYLLENDGFNILASTSFIVINEANTPPTALGQNITWDEACCGDDLLIELKGNDLENPKLIDDKKFWIVNQPKNGALSFLGTSGRLLLYNPWGDCNGEGDNDSFTFKTFDGELYSDPATVTINIIRKVNDDKPCLSMSKSEYVYNSPSNKDPLVVNIKNAPGKPGSLKYYIGILREDELPRTKNRFPGEKLAIFEYYYNSKTALNFSEPGTAKWSYDFWNLYLKPGNYKAYLLYNKYGDVNGDTVWEEEFKKEEWEDFKKETDEYPFSAHKVLAMTSFTVKANQISENRPPIVKDQSVDVIENQSILITLNGSDIDGDNLKFTLVAPPENGILKGTVPNLTYSPNANFNGSDSFKFQCSDGEFVSNISTVFINVIKKEIDPSIKISKSEYLHKSDSDKESVEIIFTDGPGNAKDWIGIYREGQSPGAENSVAWLYVDGTTSGSKSKKSGSIQFKDFFTAGSYKAYLLEDDGFTILAHASFKVAKDVVIDENIAPRSEGQNVNGDEDGFILINLLGMDDNGDKLKFIIVSQPKYGILSGTNPNLTYRPNTNFNGDDFFTFKVNNGKLDSNTSTINISVKPINDVPVVFSQIKSVKEDETVAITLMGNDSDGDNLDYTIVGQPENGILSGIAPNLYFKPNAQFKGEDSFTFKANDGKIDSKTAIVTINVIKKELLIKLATSKLLYFHNSLNDKERIIVNFSNDNGNAKDWIGIYKENQLPGVGDYLAWAYVDGTEVGNNVKKFGTVEFNEMLDPGDYNAYLLKDNGYTILASAFFKVSNENINDDNSAPIAENQNVNVDENGALIIRLKGKDNDEDKLKFTVLTQPENGILKGISPNVTYIPNPDYNGRDSFTFNVNDGKINSNTATISISVDSVKQVKIEYLNKNINSIDDQVKFNIWESVKVAYSGGQGNSLDFISAKRVGSSADSELIAGDYINLSSDFKSGNIEFGGLAPGKYILNWYSQPQLPTGGSGFHDLVAMQGFEVLSNNQGATKPDTTWTIFIYGNADHDLTPKFLNDLEEMKMAGGNEHFNILILSDLDGSQKYSLHQHNINSYFDDKITYGKVEGGSYKVIKTLPELNSDDPMVLEGFLDWGLTNYSADRYGLVLWDHGGQWMGFGGDRDNGKLKLNRPNMKSSDIKKSALKLLNAHGLTKFDFFSYDACVMAGAEILVDVHQICDVYIANPELDYGDGWDYQSVFAYLKEYPDITNIKFAQKEVQIWGAHHNRLQADREYKFHVAYDMKKFAIYNTNLKAFTAEMLKLTENISTENALTLAKIRREAIHYWNSPRKINDVSAGITDFIDIGTFAEEISKNFTGELKRVSLELVNSINDMIISKSVGTKMQGAVGLNIYYPIGGNANWQYAADQTVVYNKNTINELIKELQLNFLNSDYGGDNWLKFLGQVKTLKFNDKTPPIIMSHNDGTKSGRPDEGEALPDNEDYLIATSNNPAILDFEVSEGNDAYSAYVSLVSNGLTENPNQFIYLGEVASALLDGEGEYEVYWDASMPIISLIDSETYDPIYLGGWAVEPDSNIYISLADYQAPQSDELIPLIMYTRFSDDGYGIIEVLMEDTLDSESEIDNNLAPTSSNIVLEPGGKLWPVYYMEELNENNEFESLFITIVENYITIPKSGKDGLEISFQSVEEGDYSIEVQTFDFFDNGSEVLTYYVEVPEEQGEDLIPELSIELKNGKIFVSWPIEFADYSLEWVDDLSVGNLFKVPVNQIDILDDSLLYKHEPKDRLRYYRLIKQ